MVDVPGSGESDEEVDDAASAAAGLGDPGSEDVPRELRRAFWGLVAVFNVGLFASAFGAMLVAFRGEWRVGGAIALVGVASLAYGVRRYRVYRREGA